MIFDLYHISMQYESDFETPGEKPRERNHEKNQERHSNRLEQKEVSRSSLSVLIYEHRFYINQIQDQDLILIKE